jgi:aldose 1-epimerase
LNHAEQELTVVEVGGGIRTYTSRGQAVIDGYQESEMCSGGRGQLLAPWPNRLGDGCFEWDGTRLQTPLSEPENHNAIHGLVRWAAWSVAAVNEAEARLTYRLHPQPGWPWPLELAVAYALSDAGLEVVTEVTNVGDDASGTCPVGFGWHPYLDPFGGMVDQTVLTLPAAEAYQSDSRGLPTGRHPVEGTSLDFRSGRTVGEAVLDVAFTALDRDGDGRATIQLVPTARGDGQAAHNYGIRMWMDRDYTHAMIFSGDTVAEPARRRRGLAVEPMTCAPDMLRSGDGRRVLEPGESLIAAWGLETFSLD